MEKGLLQTFNIQHVKFLKKEFKQLNDLGYKIYQDRLHLVNLTL